MIEAGVNRELILQDGALISSITQDCNAIAEHTKAMHRDGNFGSGDMRLAASIPLVFIEKYLIDAGITFQEFAISPDHKRRLLSDPGLADFRVWKGLV